MTVTPMRRNSPRVIAADYFADAPRTLLLGVAIVLSRSFGGTPLSTLLGTASLVYLGILLCQPPLRYLCTRYRVGPHALVHEVHFILRSTRTLRWSAVTALEVDAPWSHRLLGICKVTVSQAQGEERRIHLRGVSPRVVDEIRQHLGQPSHVSSPVIPAPDPTTVSPDAASHQRSLVHAAGVGELCTMALAQGQALILGAALALSAWDVLDSLSLLGSVGAVVSSFPPAFVVLGCSMLAIGAGMAATLVRYHGFRVELLEDGSVMTCHGLLTRAERRFDVEEVLGLVIHQNLLELCLGRARLGILTRDARARMGTNVVLPSSPFQQVEHLARTHFPLLGSSVTVVRGSAPRALLLLGATSSPAVALTALSMAAGAPRWVTLLTAAGTWMVAREIGLGLHTRFEEVGARRLLSVSTRFSHTRHTLLSQHAVHATGSAFLNPDRIWWTWVLVFAGGPKRFVSLRPEPRATRAMRPQPSDRPTIADRSHP